LIHRWNGESDGLGSPQTSGTRASTQAITPAQATQYWIEPTCCPRVIPLSGANASEQSARRDRVATHNPQSKPRSGMVWRNELRRGEDDCTPAQQAGPRACPL